MMDFKRTIKVGIPRALVYYEHNEMWSRFFEAVGCKVIISPHTNKEILNYGVSHCCNEVCLPVKVYHGHVCALLNKTDFVFIPRYISYIYNESTCPKFCGLPDMVRHNLKNKANILEIVVDVSGTMFSTKKSLKDLAEKLSINYKKVYKAYMDIIDANLKKPRHKISAPPAEGPGIAVFGHPYMIYDRYLSMKLIDKLKNKGINVITYNNIDYDIRRAMAHPYANRFFWSIGLDNLGGAQAVMSYPNLKGIIYLTPFACGIDSVVMKFIEKKLRSKPHINWLKLSIDEHTGEAGFDTRIEAFLDMIYTDKAM